MRTLGFVAAGLFVSSVVVANWLTSTFHFVPVGFGQSATAGTFAAGFALASRDVVQDILGKKWMLTALLAAGLVSFQTPGVWNSETAVIGCAIWDGQIPLDPSAVTLNAAPWDSR